MADTHTTSKETKDKPSKFAGWEGGKAQRAPALRFAPFLTGQSP